ncbi:MAG: tRNA (adenosine(37)-N6)-threonylcarbamoyltransferase complex dimerization subunit type 1 TsaB [Spirochaetia bacterium]
MNTLAIDTATESLAVTLESGEHSINLSAQVGYRHGENLIPYIEFLFNQLGIAPEALDLVVCNRGPGSFTGLRIGLSTAKGIRSGTGCPLVAISGLDALGYRFRLWGQPVLPVIDARKNRFYCALYEGGERRGDYYDARPGELASLINERPGVLLTGPHAGTALEKIRDAGLPLTTEPQLFATPVESGTLLELGKLIFEQQGAASPAIGPLYLRKSEAELNAGEDKGK